MALNATPGSADANSYGTLLEAEAYFATRMYTEAWDALPDDDAKEGVLIWATSTAEARVSNEWVKTQLPEDATIRVITTVKGDDECFIVWNGSPVDEVQALSWPRKGMTTRNGFELPSTEVPKRLKEWQFEIALGLATEDRTAENAATALGLVGLKAGPVDLKFSTTAPNPKLITGATMQVLPRNWWYVFELQYSNSVTMVTL